MQILFIILFLVAIVYFSLKGQSRDDLDEIATAIAKDNDLTMKTDPRFTVEDVDTNSEGVFEEHNIRHRDYKIGDGYKRVSYHLSEVQTDRSSIAVYTTFFIIHIFLWKMIGFEQATSGNILASLLFYLPPLVFLFNIYFAKNASSSKDYEEQSNRFITSEVTSIVTLVFAISYFGVNVREHMSSKQYSQFLFLLSSSFIIGSLAVFQVRTQSTTATKVQTMVRNSLLTLSATYLLATVTLGTSHLTI